MLLVLISLNLFPYVHLFALSLAYWITLTLHYFVQPPFAYSLTHSPSNSFTHSLRLPALGMASSLFPGFVWKPPYWNYSF
jgi:hypothetical protein